MAPSLADEVRKMSFFLLALSSPALIYFWTEQESIILEITFEAFHFDAAPVDLPGTVITD